jgi:hypothetical protein
MPFLSALVDSAWQALDQGWELWEHRDRAAEVQRRRKKKGACVASSGVMMN